MGHLVNVNWDQNALYKTPLTKMPQRQNTSGQKVLKTNVGLNGKPSFQFLATGINHFNAKITKNCLCLLYMSVLFVAVSLMPVADRPASTGDVTASPIARCHSYDLRAKSFSVPSLKHGRTSVSNVDSPPSLSPFVPSKRRRLSSYSSSSSPSGIVWTVTVSLVN